MASHPDVQGFFDEATNTVSYVVSDPATKIHHLRVKSSP